jgi:pimeloyl-ACP methyl ester carboxylesterase
VTRTAQIAAGTGLTLAGLAGINALVGSRSGRLPEALAEGERREYAWRHGRVSYQVAGEGIPLLLLHGTYAGASNYEWRRNFGPRAEGYRVYAPDLLGFGHSDRPALAYSDDLYTDLVHDFTRDVVCDACFAIADSYSSSFLIADAAANPCCYLSLILICPPPIEARNGTMGLGARAFGALLRAPLVGTALYHRVVSCANIEAELSKVYGRREAFDEDTVRYYHRSSHQPGAKWAASAFIAGMLKRDVRGEFRSLQMPVLLVWGDEAAYTPVSNAAGYLAANPHAELRVFPECGSLPHEEYPEQFNELVQARFQVVVEEAPLAAAA